MSYITNNLLPGEKIEVSEKASWMVLAFPSAIVVICLIWFFSSINAKGGLSTSLGVFLSPLFGIIALAIILLLCLPVALTSEIFLTNQRVMAKTGFINRVSIELPYSKVEGIMVHQSIFGRLFGYGNIFISSSGGGMGTPILGIKSPQEFRKKYIELLEKYGTPSA